jgi:hypothetical protein
MGSLDHSQPFEKTMSEGVRLKEEKPNSLGGSRARKTYVLVSVLLKERIIRLSVRQVT